MFSKRLQKLRKSKGYSMDTLAEAYNRKFGGKMNKSTLSRYENNLQEPMYSVVVNLAKLFDVSVDYLTCTDGKEGRKIAENTVIYNRNGEVVGKKFTKEQMDYLEKFINSIGDNDCDL